MANFSEFWSQYGEMLVQGIGETLYMTLASSFFAYVLGLPLGVLLTVTSKDGLRPNKVVNGVLGVVVNVLRSIPFIILLILMLPVTRKIVGTSIGASAVIVPLVGAAFPYVARLVESSLKEVSPGVIEAAQSMGASNFKIVTKVLIPEAKPALFQGAAIAVTTILGYSTMAGFVGGGGLGDIAVRYGYYRNVSEVMLTSVALLVIIVQILQETGSFLSRKTDKRIS